MDSSARQQLNTWSESAPVFKRSLLPHGLLEVFLTNSEIERKGVESTNYARLKISHMFTMTLEKLKAFLAIVLVRDMPDY